MADSGTRFRPYVSYETANMFDCLRKATGISYGKLLLEMLVESDIYVELMECYEDASDEEMENIFLGLPFFDETGNNTEKEKESDA